MFGTDSSLDLVGALGPIVETATISGSLAYFCHVSDSQRLGSGRALTLEQAIAEALRMEAQS